LKFKRKYGTVTGKTVYSFFVSQATLRLIILEVKQKFRLRMGINH